MTPQQGAQWLMKRARAMKPEMRRAEGETLGHGLKLAQKMSEGPYSQAALRRLGHPYAKRSPSPPMAPGIINMGPSKRFRKGWRRVQKGYIMSGPRNALVSTLYNNSPEARFMRGTRYMIERPITNMVARFVRPGRRVRLVEAVRRAWK